MKIHVHDPSGPDRAHLRAVEGLHLGERTRLDLVASVLGEKGRDRVRRELLSARTVAGLSVRGVAAPRIDVLAPKVDRVHLITAVEVVGDVYSDAGIVVGCISDTDGAIVLLLDIRLHIADGSLDKGARICVTGGVRNLVAGEEAEDIGVSGHGVDHACVAGIQRVVPLGIIAIDGLVWSRKIGNDIDAGVGQRGHRGIVVGGGVERVDTNDVGSELEKVWNIAIDTRGVCERVIVAAAGRCARHGGVAGVVLLVCYTPEEAGAGQRSQRRRTERGPRYNCVPLVW